VLAYLGFAAPYAVAGLNLTLGKPGTFTALAGAATLLAGLTWLRDNRERSASGKRTRPPGTQTPGTRERATPEPAAPDISRNR
jgi:hypothetical protein